MRLYQASFLHYSLWAVLLSYAPWDQHSQVTILKFNGFTPYSTLPLQNFAPTFNQLSNKVDSKKIVIGEVNCDTYGKTQCSQYNIQGFPSSFSDLL